MGSCVTEFCYKFTRDLCALVEQKVSNYQEVILLTNFWLGELGYLIKSVLRLMNLLSASPRSKPF